MRRPGTKRPDGIKVPYVIDINAKPISKIGSYDSGLNLASKLKKSLITAL